MEKSSRALIRFASEDRHSARLKVSGPIYILLIMVMPINLMTVSISIIVIVGNIVSNNFFPFLFLFSSPFVLWDNRIRLLISMIPHFSCTNLSIYKEKDPVMVRTLKCLGEMLIASLYPEGLFFSFSLFLCYPVPASSSWCSVKLANNAPIFSIQSHI